MARPKFKPTEEQRLKVSVACGAGVSHDKIALGLGIARGTLELHFAKELEHGGSERRLEILAAMYKAGMDGNVAAQKAYLATTIATPGAQPDGKKAQQDAEAKVAQKGTDWADLLPAHSSVQ